MARRSETITAEYVKKFAEQFVRNIIEDAVKQSSKRTWLIHCSENCHKLNPIYVKKLDSYICWTPERNRTSDNDADENNEPAEVVCTADFSCNSVAENRRSSIDENDVYALPVDSISKGGTNKTCKSISSHEDRCFKPTAIRALNVFRSSHHKTFGDFKLFLINLYSSNDITRKKIGSENSAFTKYYCQNNNNQRNGDADAKRKSQSKSLRLVHIQTDKDSKNVRKCNRIKRCTFSNIKRSFCNVFKSHKTRDEAADESAVSFKDRSLPPLPSQNCACPCENSENLLRERGEKENRGDESDEDAECNYKYRGLDDDDDDDDYITKAFDFASNIEKVKDYGWYWGPMSSKAAEKLLENEKDGSFIVRDSSDDRYIFSLTFKLNACIRHVRIEHGQGNFSFGNYTKFKSHTIVDFIENAVQHSRSGRYLFFLHRRPILGPMRVQLLYPVSRFKHVQSLQHMCRFVILKTVRRDLISTLPLPKPMIEYLNSKDYYTEQIF